MTTHKLDHCPRFCSNRQFCPPGRCCHCDRKRTMLMRVPQPFAVLNKDFYAIYFTDQSGVLRWTVPAVPKEKSGVLPYKVRLPKSSHYYMARVAVEHYDRKPVLQLDLLLEAVG